MNAYTDFAYIYDSCMDNIPYDDWAARITGILQENGIENGLVCELGCGTGEMTERLSAKGYDLIGIDCSEDMLMVARDKQYELAEADAADSFSILYLMQDMRELELFGTVRAFVSVCDSMNYLLTPDDLLKTFRLVNNYLDRDGLFVFDMKTAACFETFGNETRVEQYRDATLIWENFFSRRTKRNRYKLTMFLKEKKDLFRKTTETHVQQAYTVKTVVKLLQEAGMVFVGAVDAANGESVTEETERILFIAKEGFQEGKCYAPAESEQI